MKRCSSLLILILLVLALLQSCAPAPKEKIVVVTVVVPPTTQPITSTAVPPTIAATATAVPTATDIPCTNKSAYGVLDQENRRVCMLSKYYPCIRWDAVTVDMKDTLACVRGAIQRLDEYWVKKTYWSRWDFADNHTGFFAMANYGGWHPETGKHMSVGDCVAITGTVKALSDQRPYIFWGENSIFRSAVNSSNTEYYEHPDLFVIEGNPSFCE